MDDLKEQAIKDALLTTWLGKSCRVLAEVDSTNDLLKEMLQPKRIETPPAGFLLLTDYQRQGRGRLGRRWEAPPKTSLLLSILFRPLWPAEQMNWLTMLVSLAAAEAIEGQTELQVGIKWPNDLMIRQAGSWRKVSGLLLEGDFAPDGRLLWAVVGIGINVNIPEDQLPDGITPATSLLAATGRLVPRLPLLATFLHRVEHLYDLAESGHSPQPAWQNRLITLGKAVHVSHMQTGQSLSGIAEAVDGDGRLLVRDGSGQRHTVAAADVTLRES